MKKIHIAAVLVLLSLGSLQAATVTWTGLGGDGDWANDANWDSTPFLPGAVDDVVVANAGTLPSSGVTGAYLSLTVNALVNLTLNGNMTLTNAVTIDGTLSVGGNILTADSVGGTGTLNGNTGTIRVSGGFAPGAFAGGTGTVELTGGNAQTIANPYVFSTLFIDKTGGSATFTAVTSASTLTTSAAGYNIAFTSDLTVSSASVTFTNTGTLTLGNGGGDALAFDAGLNATAPSSISARAAISATNQDIVLGDAGTPVTLAGVTTISAGIGNITLGGTVDGPGALTLNSTGTTTFSGVVGGGTSLASLTTNAGGTTSINTASIQTVGAQTYNDNLTLSSGATLTGTTVTFNGTIAGGTNSLGITGNAVFGDGAGDTVTGVSTLSVSGTSAINTNTVTTSGTQTYTGNVTLGAGATLATTDSNVSFGGTVDGAQTLTVTAGTGLVSFGGVVGGGTALTSLAVTSTNAAANAITLRSVTTSTTQTYTGNVTLMGSTVLTNTTVSFGSTVTGGGFDLTLTSSGAITLNLNNITGVAAFTKNGGGGATVSGTLTTTGTQTWTDAVTLGAATTLEGTTMTFSSTVGNAASQALVITGNAAFGNTVGAVTPLASLSVSGTTSIANNIRTSTTQTYTGNVTLMGSTVLTNTTVSFGSTVTGGGFNLTLTSSGAITLDLNNITGVAAFTKNGGGGATVSGTLTTTGTQTWTDAVTLGAAATLADTTVSFGSTVTGGGFNLTLTSSGAITLNLNNITGVAAFTKNGGGGATVSGTLTTTGTQTWTDAVTLGAATTLDSGGGAILFSSTLNAGNWDLILAAGIAAGTTTFTGAVSNLGDGIGPALTVSNGVNGLVRFSNTLAGASGIQAANPGNQVRFDGDVTLGDGDTGTAITASFFDGLNFSAWDGLSFGATTLSGAAAAVNSNGSAVSFASIDGAQNLGIDAGTTGTISVTGAVGASTPPGTITIAQSNGTIFSGNVSAASLAVSDTQAGQTVSVLGNLTLSGNLSTTGTANAYHISLTGAVNSVSGTGTFANIGNLTLGDADTDTFTFTGGLTATATAANSIRGTIATGGGAGQDLTFDTFTLAGVTTLNAGAGGDLIFSAPVMVPDFAAATDLSVTAALVSAAGTSLTVQDGARADILNSSSITLNTLSLPGAASVADLGSSGFTIGTLSNLGTLRLTGLQATHAFTAFDTDSGITEYYGTGAGSLVFTAGFAGGTYWDLRIASTGAGVHTLQNPVTVNNDLHIAAGGVLDVSAANHLLTVSGNWQNDEGDVGFVARSGTVDFNKTAGVIEIRGNNTWYIFQVLSAAPGLEVHFENDLPGAGIQIRQRIALGGIFRVRGNALANSIRLDRIYLNGDPANPPDDPMDDTKFWFLDLTPGATLDMQYVEVYYSNARANPISVPANVSATPYSTYFSFKWLDFLYLIYSYTEDSDYNGKIDRIRVTAEGAIGTLVPGPVGDFSDFVVEVDGYEVDTAKGVNGYERPVSGVTFYIHLVEKPYLDTGATPDWHIVRNETLFDEASGIKRVGTLSRAGGSDWITPSDTAWPVIGYTLSVPAFGETFVHFSEPVVQTGGGTLVAGDFSAGSFARVSGTAPQTREAVVGLGPYTVAALSAGATDLTVTATTRDLGSPPYWEAAYNGQITGPPPPTYPDPVTGYLANPNTYGSFGSPGPNPGPMTRPAFQLDRGGNNTHRVSDLMVSVPPSDTVGAWSQVNPNSFFVWPLWAKDEAYVPGVPDVDYPTIPEADASGQYVGFVRLFDGTRFLRDQDFDLQAEDATGLGNPEVFYKSNIPETYRSDVPGIWLPDFDEANYSGLAARPYTGLVSKPGIAGLPSFWDYSFLESDSEIFDKAMLEFYFKLPGGPANHLYAGRLDMDPDAAAIPADWYRRVRPFGIYIRNLVTQKGGVTILNNVIDPTGGERTRLHYTIDQAGPVTVTVFTLDGDVVRSLQRGTLAVGDYTASWDGRNRAGDPVAPGMYFIRIVAPGTDEIRKVMVVRY